MRMRISLIALSAAACLVASCATAYQPNGVSGGYTDQVRSSNTAQVSFRGNGLTPPETVHSYILRRCAEVTLEDGYSYFVLVHTQAPSAETDNLYSMKVETATIEMYQGTNLKTLPTPTTRFLRSERFLPNRVRARSRYRLPWLQATTR